MRDKSVSLWKKVLVVFGIIYLISPIDALPAVAFPLSLLDDVGLWLLILYLLRNTLDKYWDGNKIIDFRKKFDDKNIVEGVEFNVEDEREKAHQEDEDND